MELYLRQSIPIAFCDKQLNKNESFVATLRLTASQCSSKAYRDSVLAATPYGAKRNQAEGMKVQKAIEAMALCATSENIEQQLGTKP